MQEVKTEGKYIKCSKCGTENFVDPHCELLPENYECDECGKKLAEEAAKATAEVEVAAKFEAFKAKNEILEEDGPEGIKYIIARTAATKEEAVEYAERFARADSFQPIMELSFLNGMLDGIRTMRRELAKLGPMYGKALVIADKLSGLIRARM